MIYDSTKWYKSWPDVLKVSLDKILNQNLIIANANRKYNLLEQLKIKNYGSVERFLTIEFTDEIKKLSRITGISELALKIECFRNIQTIELDSYELNNKDTDPNFWAPNAILSRLSHLIHCRRIKKIDFYGQDIFDLNELDLFPNLEYLKIESNYRQPTRNNVLHGIESLNKLEYLKHLDITNNYVENWDKISNNKLEELIIDSTNITDLAFLNGFPFLKVLSIRNLNLNDITGIENLENLQELRLGNTEIKDYSQLTKLAGLRKVAVKSDYVQKVSSHFESSHTNLVEFIIE